jgi:hypothetical protein
VNLDLMLVEFGDGGVFAVGDAAFVIWLAPLQAVADRDGARLGSVCLNSLERAGVELQEAGVFVSEGEGVVADLVNG